MFALAALILVWRSLSAGAATPLFSDTDDAMRMVVARDVLAGQSWYDPIQHRLNTPFGAEIHWSRLVDVPLAGLLALFTPFLGPDGAIIATGYVWPLLLLALLLWLSAGLTQRLVGPEGVLPALVLPVLSPAVTAEFNPGRVDHHNVVVLLTLATIWAGVESARRPRFAIVGGLLAATSLAIATESLPVIAAAVLVAGLLWVGDPQRAGTMRNFGLAFLAGTALHLAIYRPPARWLEAACDVLSPVYLAFAAVVAVTFTLASLLQLSARWQRLAVLALLGGLGCGLVIALYPQCLKGPYGALDPWLQLHWLAGITEAKPWLSSLFELPGYVAAVGLPVLLALVVVLVRLWKQPRERDEWAALFLFMLATAVIMLAQVRGARLAIMPAMPAAAWLIVSARHHYLRRASIGSVAGLVGSWLGFAGVLIALLVTIAVNLAPTGSAAAASAAARQSREACLVPSAFADLAPLPPERIMSPIDLGSHLLLYTPHSVVAAPYHRNERGVRDAFRFFNDPISEARAILETRGIGLVVICPSMPEVSGLSERAGDSFAALYEANALPAWLSDVSLPDSPLKVFAVLP